MKKIVLILILAVTSFSSFATSNYTSATGNVVIPDVSVDGKTYYDSVTLKLNFANGTFSVLSATPKNAAISTTPLQTFSSNNAKVDFMGCTQDGTNQITCYVNFTNNGNDSIFWFYGNYGGTSTLYDNLGNSYTAQVSAFSKTSSSISSNVLQGVPVQVSFTFTGINIHATSITAFEPEFYSQATGNDFTAIFKNITF